MVQLFARQLTSNQGAVAYEEYPEFDSGSVSFSDGAGVRVSLSGDRSSLRMVLSAALALVRPPDPDHDPTGTTFPRIPLPDSADVPPEIVDRHDNFDPDEGEAA
jgi:hypothetical protein